MIRIHKLTIVLTLLLMTIALGCMPSAYARDGHARRKPKKEIVIYFDNDVHGKVDGYAKISALRQQTIADQTPYVTLLSCGDFSQGSHLCAFSHGRDIITLLNKAGYDIITLGNHEFDYGAEHVPDLTQRFAGDVVLCNYEDLRTGQMVYPAYTIRRFGKVKVGFVGVLNPSTELSDAPQSYYDSRSRKIYSFHFEDVYELTQQAIDAALAEGADYVIVISHLGENMGLHHTSLDLIAHTHGATVVLDGHAHHSNEGQYYADARGDSVLFMTTGERFDNVGELRIDSKGNLSHRLIKTTQLTSYDPVIMACIDSLETAINTTPPFGYTDFDLLGYDSYGVYDRNCETNLGNLCADAIREAMGADVAWVNAGGIRASIRQGGFGIREVIDMYPFENSLCLATVKGYILRDAIEYCMAWYPEDTGNFPLLSGIHFTFDPTIPSAAVRDSRGALQYVCDTVPHRVTEILVKDNTGEYVPLQLDKDYTLAAASFLLKNGGCGGIFNDSQLLFDSGTIDTQSFEDFITFTLKGRIPEYYRNVRGRIRKAVDDGVLSTKGRQVADNE